MWGYIFTLSLYKIASVRISFYIKPIQDIKPLEDGNISKATVCLSSEDDGDVSSEIWEGMSI